MEVLHDRCAGLDLSKRDAKPCVRVVAPGKVRAKEEITTWSSMTAGILALRDHLIAMEVTCVAMEATGDYWAVLLRVGGRPVPVDAGQRARGEEPAGTQDRLVSDAAWLAQLAAHGCCGPRSCPRNRSASCGT